MKLFLSMLSHSLLTSSYVFTFFNGEGKGEFAFFSAERLDRRNRADLLESATSCYDAQMLRSYRVWTPFHLTVLAAKSENYTTAPQNLQLLVSHTL